MTDNEFMQHLEWLNMVGDNIGSITVGKEFVPKVIDFIGRQQAEIERLERKNEFLLSEYEKSCDLFLGRLETAKAEALKECLQEVRKRTSSYICAARIRWVTDEIEKEMVGED